MTKKEMQKIDKEMVENVWEKAKKVWISDKDRHNGVERLDYCQAMTCQKSGYTFLISYNTIVAFVDESGNMYDVLRLVYGYTATSAKHIAKFRNKFRHVTEHTWREV